MNKLMIALITTFTLISNVVLAQTPPATKRFWDDVVVPSKVYQRLDKGEKQVLSHKMFLHDATGGDFFYNRYQELLAFIPESPLTQCYEEKRRYLIRSMVYQAAEMHSLDIDYVNGEKVRLLDRSRLNTSDLLDPLEWIRNLKHPCSKKS